MVDNIRELGALGMVALAMVVIAYLAFMQSESALGALISVVSAGIGFYLRGRIQDPNP
jgi:hypothetical protein